MTEKATDLRQKAAECERKREESFQRCDTDGFLTQWAHGLSAQKYRAQAEIEEAGGVSTFRGLYRRSDGKRVAAKLIAGKFGPCWAFCDSEGSFTGRFIGDSKGTPRSRLYKEGFEVREETAPAKAIITGEGRGLSGTAWVAVIRTDGGFPTDAEVV
jgi:hypothetical protein